MTVPSEAAAFERPVGRSTLRIFHGNLAEVRADVLVASDDDKLLVDGGVAASLEHAGGLAIYEEARRSLPVELGAVIPTNAGTLPAQRVYHAIVVDRTGQTLTTTDLIQRVVERCLKLCDEHGFRSIAFPALATGAGRFSAEASAMAIVVQIYRYLRGTTKIDSVNIVLYRGRGHEMQTAERFYTQVRQYLEVMSSLDLIGTTLNAGQVPAKADRVKAALERDALLSDPGIAGERWATHDTFRQLDEIDAELTSVTNRSTSSDVNTGVSGLREARSGLKRRPLVISLHGIRTRGAWQKEITLPINRAGFDHVPLDYGRFGLIRFPWTRQGRIPWFRDRYDAIRKEADGDLPSVIAHSLGSYIVANAIADYNCEFREVIFCGAIVATDYDWPTVIEQGRVRRVLNDYGGLDIWPRFARNILHDAGVSGVQGFSKIADGRVVNRSHEAFRHSDYFYEGNYREAWIPFLLGQDPKAPTNPKPPGRNRAFWRNVVRLASECS